MKRRVKVFASAETKTHKLRPLFLKGGFLQINNCCASIFVMEVGLCQTF